MEKPITHWSIIRLCLRFSNWLIVYHSRNVCSSSNSTEVRWKCYTKLYRSHTDHTASSWVFVVPFSVPDSQNSCWSADWSDLGAAGDVDPLNQISERKHFFQWNLHARSAHSSSLESFKGFRWEVLHEWCLCFRIIILTEGMLSEQQMYSAAWLCRLHLSQPRESWHWLLIRWRRKNSAIYHSSHKNTLRASEGTKLL